jgi:hypothetical protein
VHLPPQTTGTRIPWLPTLAPLAEPVKGQPGSGPLVLTKKTRPAGERQRHAREGGAEEEGLGQWRHVEHGR